ncbi:MAG: DEAD/DEAH box helicase family protein [[Actinobacillus] rossii]|nr:DEAD/DEAH box helicase family protein [[Actinobacillus] rossii]MDY4504832.1 DEAD/DEAH box helicase family protein [[Actinobacillus] rossii]
MLLKRIGAYLKNGTISHQGMKFTTPLENGRMWETREMTDAEKLKFIREEVVRWNAEFDTWLKADAQFMRDIAERANAPENLQFAKVDDESEVAINGASGEFKLHGYQNAFVRKSAREFSGVNSFGVGLGKTATALASAQYALETGTKKKVCFIVPNAVLSNWNKESGRYYNESEKERCLFVGADIDKNGEFVVDSKNYARDLNAVLENKHNKIFMTQQAFEKIRLRTETAENYIAYMSEMDNAFAESQNAAKDEKAKAKGANLAADIAGNNKLDNAPYFEDLGIDALIVDEAHHFKNAKQALKVAKVKGLPSGKPSARAIDMGVKSWVIRNGNVRKDGVMLLTATPVTNSPLEIYAMMSLAVGEERIKQAFLGNINGADNFIEAICEIQCQEESNMANETVSVQALIGIKNLELVKNLIQTNADVKEAKDVGISFRQVESEDVSDGVSLDSATKRAVNRYQNAYRLARLRLKGDSLGEHILSPTELDDYDSVLEEVGSVEKIGHPFSMVKRISNALLDLELNSGKTYYTVKDIKAAKRAVVAFNDAKRIFTFETENEPDDVDLIVKIKNIKTDNGDKKQIFIVKAVATLEDNQVILSCNEFNAQLKLETLLDSENADVSVSISPKVAALIENVKKEQAHIRYTQADGSKPKFAKQIIFVESLAMHTKIKRILAKEAGIPVDRITFISGQFNSDPDEIIEVQESFNADGEANKYSIVIANKKAEVGINLQKGCQAIHHLELNWTPDSITQRNGRGVRQGNTAEKVNVYQIMCRKTPPFRAEI